MLPAPPSHSGGAPPNGYCLIVDDTGGWYISNGGTKGAAREQESIVAHGKLPAAAAGDDAGWIGVTLSLSLKFAGKPAPLRSHN